MLLIVVIPGAETIKKHTKTQGRSSRLLRQEFPHLCQKLPTLWTKSYSVQTVGGAPLEIIKQYIENQKNQ
jgi:putative transposase